MTILLPRAEAGAARVEPLVSLRSVPIRRVQQAFSE